LFYYCPSRAVHHPSKQQRYPKELGQLASANDEPITK
jgi:hypothetical protein